VDTADVAGLPGVKILGQEGGQNLTVQVEGEMDRLIKTLARHPVRFFETERPSLEEIFLSYYADDRTSDV
jgi:ABC-2 type transport system ATP-binding protein